MTGLVLVAGGLFAAEWLLVFGRDVWGSLGRRCLPASADGDPARIVASFLACTDAVRRRQAWATTSGPALLLAGGWAGAVLAPVRIRHARKGRAPQDPALTDIWATVLEAAGVTARHRPRLLVDGDGGRRLPQAYGLPGRYRVAVGPGVAVAARTAASQARPKPVPALRVLAHELGHVAMRDVLRTYITCAAAATFAVLVPVLFLDAVRHHVAFPLGWRLFVITALVAWCFVRVMRLREHDADLFAARILATLPSAAAAAWTLEPGVPRPPGRGRLWHPTHLNRQHVLNHPESLSRWWWIDTLVAAVAAGLALIEIPLQVDVLLPGPEVIIYAATATTVLLPTLAVAWLSAPPLPAGVPTCPGRVVGPGLALAGILPAGLMVGSVLAPRSAAVWWTAFPQAPDYGSDLRWWTAAPTVAWGLTVSLLVMAGLLGLATAVLRRRAAGSPTALFGISISAGLLTGWWFLLIRVAVGTRTSDAVAVAGGSYAAASVPAGLLVSAALVWAGARRQRRRAVCALGGLTLLAAVALGARATAIPDARLLDTPPPLLPASASLFSSCLWIESTTSTLDGGWSASPHALAIAAYLVRTTDPLLHAVGITLEQASRDGDLTQQATAQRAATRRCLLALTP